MMIVRVTGYTGSSYCRIYVNGSNSWIQAEASSGSLNEYSSATNTLVKHLNKGDEVYLWCIDVTHMYWITSFSGVLIQPDVTVP